MVRAFIAVDLPVDMRSTSGRTTKAPTHLTLRFLGEVRAEEVPEIGRALGRAVEDRPAFQVHLRGVGAFPNARVPKVVWIGIEEGARELTEIANRISEELELLGRPREPRPFVPHLTLMRVRDRRSSEEAYRWLTLEAERDFGTLPVREVFLKESRLTREGPIHTVIQTSPLMGDLLPRSCTPPGPTPNDQPPST
jgi:2'-5' RNA ligase